MAARRGKLNASETPPTATKAYIWQSGRQWLERRHEEIIEPELPIVDLHHHLVYWPEISCYLLPDCSPTPASGHNVTATVYLDWLSMYRAHGPAEPRPIGEIESLTASRR